MKKVEILICSEEGFWVHGGREGGGGVCQYDFYVGQKKREKKGRKIHRFNNPRYKNGPLLLTNENLFGKDSETREL